MGLFNRTDNSDSDDDKCPTSGWGVRPAAASSGECPQGHKATTTSETGRKGVSWINPHPRGN